MHPAYIAIVEVVVAPTASTPERKTVEVFDFDLVDSDITARASADEEASALTRSGQSARVVRLFKVEREIEA